MFQPKVSIQIPTYNQSKWIVRTIESALEQTYKNIEVVVLNDSSTDDTQKLISAINDTRLRVFENDKNLGRVKTYYRLLHELSTGEWVVNLDGDDFFTDKNFISKAIETIAQEKEAVWYMANHKKISQAKKYCLSHETIDSHTLKINGIDYLEHYNKIRSFSHLGSLYKREYAIDAGFYSFDSLITDFASLMRICKYGNVIITSTEIGCWNENENSDSRKTARTYELKKNIASIKELCAFYTNELSPMRNASLEKGLVKLHEHYSNLSYMTSHKGLGALKYLFQHFSWDFNGLHLLSKFRI